MSEKRNAAPIIAIVVLIAVAVLAVPCVLGALFFGGMFAWQAGEVSPQPDPLTAPATGMAAEGESSKPANLAEPQPPTLTPEGVESLNAEGPAQVIYYKRKFASPPYLTFPAGRAGWDITDQKADSFTVQRGGAVSTLNLLLQWKAEGQPAQPVPASDE